MSKCNKKLLNNSSEMLFANDFVGLLLPMLYQNGVYEINETELSKKLFYYYNDPMLNELFLDMQPVRGEKILDIHEAMYNEKFFSGKIWWTSNNPKHLHLNYEDADTTYHERRLTKYGIQAIQTIAKELANVQEIESKSKHRIHIYKNDPNQNYILVHGSCYHTILHNKLITDGNIKKINYFDKSKYENVYWQNPTDPEGLIVLRNNNARQVYLENANYTVIQGLKNEVLTDIQIYTNLMDKKTLQKISDIANSQCIIEDATPIEDEIYIKKLSLK